MIPNTLFSGNTLLTSFDFTFALCSNLQSIQPDLFRYNSNAFSFTRTFYQCSKLQLNSNIFYSGSEINTRFFNLDFAGSGFTECFYRDSFTGVQGTAPDLWNCNFGTGVPDETGCYGGSGNSLTSLSNYALIPGSWL